MTITIREPGSAITHLIGLLLAAFAAIPMLVKAALFSTRTAVAAMAVFMKMCIRDRFHITHRRQAAFLSYYFHYSFLFSVFTQLPLSISASCHFHKMAQGKLQGAPVT